MKLFVSFVTFLLFLGPVVMALVGWPVEGDLFTNKHLYPAFYILELYIGYCIISRKLDLKKAWAALGVIIAIMAYYSISKNYGRTPSKMVCFNSMMLPAFYYLLLFSVKHINTVRKSVKFTMLSMYVVNCLLAIYERVFMYILFPFDKIRSDMNMTDVTDWSIFRSNALLGHPLSNALIMSIIMIFILVSEMKTRIKLFLYSLGMISLFCFNARGAILISIIAFIIYYGYFNYKKISIKTIAIATFLFCLVYFLYNRGLAGRFSEQGDFSKDSSVLARIDVWSIIFNNNLSDFLWGMSGNKIEDLAFKTMGIMHIENWFILSVLSVGLLLTITVLLLFVPVFKESLTNYNKKESFLLLFVTIGIASTNNSLACGVPAIAFFFACCFTFDKKINRKAIFRTENL